MTAGDCIREGIEKTGTDVWRSKIRSAMPSSDAISIKHRLAGVYYLPYDGDRDNNRRRDLCRSERGATRRRRHISVKRASSGRFSRKLCAVDYGDRPNPQSPWHSPDRYAQEYCDRKITCARQSWRADRSHPCRRRASVEEINGPPDRPLASQFGLLRTAALNTAPAHREQF